MTWQTPEEYRALPQAIQRQMIDREWPTDEDRPLTPAEQRLLFARLLLATRQYNQIRAENKAHRDMMAKRAACPCFRSQPLGRRLELLNEARTAYRAARGQA